jgi:hypothetical protein
MKSIKTLALAGALAFACATQPVLAAGFFTNGVPVAGGVQYPLTIPLTGNETVPADTNLTSGQNPASEAITTTQLANFARAQSALVNAVIGGDSTTNLYQRATAGASVTTTLTYGGPDRWAYWSGAGTAMTVSRDATATDVPLAYQSAFKMARTAGQTGLVQMCMVQEIATKNSILFQGQVAELDFNAYTGANFSAASSNMTVYLVTGTGTDEGVSKLAFALNAGGGGAGAWTGQANATAAVISLGAVSTAGYSAVANIPNTATELAVVLCYTPVGTAGTNDYVAFSGIQLVRNPALTSLASATVGYNSSQLQQTSFQRRLAADEAILQEQYFYRFAEPANGAGVAGFCEATGANTNVCNMYLPVVMQAAIPTIAITTAGTFKVNIAGVSTTIATPTAGVCASQSCTVTAANTNTAGQAESLTGGGGTGAWDVSAEF